VDSKPDTRKPIPKPVKVTIFNNTYTLTAHGDPSELLGIAREVDELMHSISERAGSSDPSRVAVLACLHMADRLHTLEAITDHVNHRAIEFSELLEQVLQPE
jgi:cell division protein ZapA